MKHQDSQEDEPSARGGHQLSGDQGREPHEFQQTNSYQPNDQYQSNFSNDSYQNTGPGFIKDNSFNRNQSDMNSGQIGASNFAHDEKGKSYSTTKNVGDGTLEDNSMAKARISSKYSDQPELGQNSKETMKDNNVPERHARRSSFNKQAIMATLGLGNKGDKHKSEQFNTSYTTSGKAKTGNMTQNEELTNDYQPSYLANDRRSGNKMENDNLDSKHRAPNSSRADDMGNERSNSDVLKSASSDRQYNRSGFNSAKYDTKSERLAGTNYATERNTTDMRTYPNTVNVDSKEMQEPSGMNKNAHRTDQYMAQKEGSAGNTDRQYLSSSTKKSSAKNVEHYKSDDPLFEGQTAESPRMKVTDPDSRTENSRIRRKSDQYESTTLDPKSNSSSDSKKQGENGVWSSVMGAVGLGRRGSHPMSDSDYETGLESKMRDSRITDKNEAETSMGRSERRRSIPKGTQRNSIPENVSQVPTTSDVMRESGRQQGYRVNDNDYQIPGTYSTSVGNSSSMVDPSKQTYGATSAENTTGKSYTTSGSNKHIRNVSVGGAADYPSTSEHQPMYQNRTEYQYNTDSSIPRTANKEEGDFQTQDEPTMVKKISETIKSTLY